VLRGATQTLRNAHAVLIELNRSVLESNGSSPERITAILRESDLVHQRIISEGATRLSAASIPNVLATRSRTR
jgi:hypothetical protein